MPMDRRTVEAGLLAKGFRQRQGDHHFFVYWTQDGLKTPVFTKTSHGARDIGDPLLSVMARQCRLERWEFLDLIDCRLGREAYQARLEQNGHI